ncbi:hypothetical protein ACP2AV_09235 [Aliiroseovarius sp. PTFE2010]|uniref:hypothetical protein n=1 Tax=Aliiroseovarius sp. PTFE2010 TaxID=3417190 RepID=UPI003CFB7D57
MAPSAAPTAASTSAPIEALAQCAAQDLPFWRTFRQQYLITRETLDLPGFSTCKLAGWILYSPPNMARTRIEDETGKHIGYLTGIASLPGGLLGPSHRIPGLLSGTPGALDRFHDWLDDLAGRYTILLAVNDETRVYTDPATMHGAVYNRETGRVAASPLLCLDRPVELNPAFDHRWHEEHGGKYSLFHTRDRAVRRMNPNFYLDLDNFHETRFWPRQDSFALSDPDAAMDEIIATTRAHMTNISGGFDSYLPLTGGRDSRLLLAMGGQALDNVTAIFTNINNYATRRDAALAEQLCAAVGQPHQVNDKRKVKRPRDGSLAQAQAAFHVATATKLPLPDEYQTNTISGLAPNTVVLRGHQTDLLRAVYVAHTDKRKWKNFNWQINKLLIGPSDQRARIHARFDADYRAWLQTLPPAAQAKQIDFMFLEIYYPSSIGATFPGLSRNLYLSPFNARRLIGLALGFDDVARRKRDVVNDIIHRANPALDAVPYTDELGSDLGDLQDDAKVAAMVQPRQDATLARAAQTPPRA